MQYVVTAAEMRQIDAATIDGIGLPGAVLMENAGRAVAGAVVDELAADRGGSVAVVCGAGNNGGDGYVAARVLRARGVAAVVLLAVPRRQVRGDALLHLGAYEQSGGLATEIATAAELAEHREAIEGARVVVDALFGTGLTRPVEGHMAAVIEVVNLAAGRVVAVDIPSGLSADRGVPLGCAVRADRTVTMALRKVALAVSPGLGRAGRVAVAEIGIPLELAPAHGVRLAVLERGDVADWVRRPDLLDHKTRRGHVLVVAGSPGKRGAARLTAMAALRSGAGLVTLASEGEAGAPDPVMTAALDCDAAGAVDRLVELAGRARAVAIGPGMPTSGGGRALVEGALARLEVPLVLDADALNHVAANPAAIAAARAPVVLTPHPGEAGRLLGTGTAEVEADRVGAVRALAERTGAVVVLKGPGTLVCDGGIGDGFVTINPTGDPALATAGSGDVLTGVVAALCAQGIGAGQAARLAVWVHGVAGERCREGIGAIGVTASDVLEAIPAAFREL
jgi:NAD(P)H-hydrate epimerase